MSIISGYTLPQTGVIDFIFGGGIVAAIIAVIGLIYWSVSRIFGKTIFKNDTVMRGKVKNDSK